MRTQMHGMHRNGEKVGDQLIVASYCTSVHRSGSLFQLNYATELICASAAIITVWPRCLNAEELSLLSNQISTSLFFSWITSSPSPLKSLAFTWHHFLRQMSFLGALLAKRKVAKSCTMTFSTTLRIWYLAGHSADTYTISWMLSKWQYWKSKNTNRKALQCLEMVHGRVDCDYLNMFSEWFMAIMVSESLTVKVLETES